MNTVTLNCYKESDSPFKQDCSWFQGSWSAIIALPLTSLCLKAPTSLFLPALNLGNSFISFLGRECTEVTGLRERGWGISSSSLYGTLALTPWIAPPSLDHGARGSLCCFSGPSHSQSWPRGQGVSHAPRVSSELRSKAQLFPRLMAGS